MAMRVGLGSDTHRLARGDGLKLGGVNVPCELAAEAVSDGDVLLHALVDALLGAAGLGDIGDWFPEAAVTKGEDSRRFLAETLAEIATRGGFVVNVDCVIHLEKPRLAPWKNAIAEKMAYLLGIDAARVNVKAKTAEGMGPVGRGEAVAAEVVVLVGLPD